MAKLAMVIASALVSWFFWGRGRGGDDPPTPTGDPLWV